MSSKSEHEVHIGKIKYVDYTKDFIPEANLMTPFLHKRKSYEYENELRAINLELPVVDGKVDLSREPLNRGKNIPVDLDILIEKIFVAPTAPKWFYELVESILDKFGLEKEVIQSSLDEDPVY